MKIVCLLVAVFFALLLSGCVFPGDAIIRPVTLQSYLPDSEAHTASLAQLAHHATRPELIAFASRGQLPDVPGDRAVNTPIVEQHFTAEFDSFMEPALVWILPPLGFQPATDILIRLDSASPRTYVLRRERLYRVSASTGALAKCSPETVRCSSPAARGIKTPITVHLKLLP